MQWASLPLLSDLLWRDIVYTGNWTVGSATAELSVTTDGTIGILGTGNVLDWTIKMTEGADTFTLFGPSAAVTPNCSSKVLRCLMSLTDLMFDFDAATGLALFQSSGIGSSQTFYVFRSMAALIFPVPRGHRPALRLQFSAGRTARERRSGYCRGGSSRTRQPSPCSALALPVLPLPRRRRQV